MDENKKDEPTNADPKTRNKQERINLIEQANAAAQRLEEANRQKEALLDREEASRAEDRLGGNTDAGKVVRIKQVEETPEEYANRVLAGDANPLA